MDVIYSLIPGMMFFGLIFFSVLIWAVKKGQYEDMEGNASRILMEDDDYDEWMSRQPIVPSDVVAADKGSIPKEGTIAKQE